MNYGCKNEINAVGTLIGKIMSVIYPTLTFTEESTYLLKDTDSSNPLLAVSPDGSLRQTSDGTVYINGPPKVSLEIKCPFFTQHTGKQVYYNAPKRHLCQSFFWSRQR